MTKDKSKRNLYNCRYKLENAGISIDGLTLLLYLLKVGDWDFPPRANAMYCRRIILGVRKSYR